MQGGRKERTPEKVGSEGWGANISRFFSPAFWASLGSFCAKPRWPKGSRGFITDPKGAHTHNLKSPWPQPAATIQREDPPRERKKSENRGGGGETIFFKAVQRRVGSGGVEGSRAGSRGWGSRGVGAQVAGTFSALVDALKNNKLINR